MILISPYSRVSKSFIGECCRSMFVFGILDSSLIYKRKMVKSQFPLGKLSRDHLRTLYKNRSKEIKSLPIFTLGGDYQDSCCGAASLHVFLFNFPFYVSFVYGSHEHKNRRLTLHIELINFWLLYFIYLFLIYFVLLFFFF